MSEVTREDRLAAELHGAENDVAACEAQIEELNGKLGEVKQELTAARREVRMLKVALGIPVRKPRAPKEPEAQYELPVGVPEEDQEEA